MFDRPCQVMTLEGSYEDIGRQRAERMLARRTPFVQYLLARWGVPAGGAGAGSGAPWRCLARTLERFCPQLLDETRGLARGLGVAERDILAAWARPGGGAGQHGACTLFAVNVGAAAGASPLVGRNFDLRQDDMDRCLVLARPRGGPVTLGGNGWVGLADGASDAGLVVVAAEVDAPPSSPGDAWGAARGVARGALRFPMIVRVLLETCRTVAGALDIIAQLPHMSPFNYLIADADGRAAAAEVCPGHGLELRWPAGGGVAATNHFVSPRLAPLARPVWLTHRRLRIVSEAIAARREPWGVADCQRLLARPGVVQGRITLWSEVFEPAARRAWYAPGPPDRNPFHPFSLTSGETYDAELAVTV